MELTIRKSGVVMKSKDLVEYAVVDHLHLMVKDLFKSLPKADKEKRLHVKQTYGDYQIEVRGFAQLDGFDLSLLQTIIAMAGVDQKVIDPSPKGMKGKELREKLNLEYDSQFEKALVVDSTYRKLAAQMGRRYGGSFTEDVKESLKNISTTSFFIETKKGKSIFGFNIISTIVGSDTSFTIALNPFLASAIFGERNFAKIFLTESRKLKTEAARILHSKLSGLVNAGGERIFNMETIIEMIWTSEATPATKRKRKERLIGKVLPDLQNSGWTASELDGVIKIRRPKPPPVQKQLSLL